MTDNEVLEILLNKNSRIAWDHTSYKLEVCHGDIPQEQLQRLIEANKLQQACNGAPVWWLR